MKKLFAILLALTVFMSLSITAFAENGATYDASKNDNVITITKTLTATGTSAVYPGDTLSFTASDGTVTQATAGTVAPVLPAIPDVTVAEGATSATINVTLPVFTTVGVYTYQITENDTNVAGVTYRTDAIKLVLTVIEDEGKKVIAAVHCEAEGQTKTDVFENTYKANDLKVAKTVSGNMGDKSKDWNFTVTLKAPAGDTVNGTITCTDTAKNIAAGWTGEKTVTFVLKHGESFELKNIPDGVTYTVVETESGEDDYTTTGEVKTFTALSADTTVTVNNEKTTTPDTGITLDSLPYILLLVAVAAAVVVMVIRKRRTIED